MNQKTRYIVNSILAVILLFGLTKFTMARYENRSSRQDYEQAMQLAGIQQIPETTSTESPTAPTTSIQQEQSSAAPLPEDPIILEMLEIDLDALREENEDVIGWIRIPDTKVNYPLLQWTDNDFYLDHTWNQSSNASGSIFMECQNQPDFSQFNTIIYGHNMNNGDMFGSLHYYRRTGYLDQHPYIYIAKDEGVFRFDIFAAQSANTKSIIYGLGIETDQRKEEFLRYAKDYSFFESDVTPTVDDHILTLSTCSGSGYGTRWVVISLLNRDCSYIRPA